tara:strand:- start:922 stop:1623 length:702 start_codon:yes stop_codon:yes gene_type:complete
MAIRRPPTTFSDSITGADLASDIAISTTGNIATTGSGTLTVAGTSTLTGALSVDTISEKTSANGVSIDGLKIKDYQIMYGSNVGLKIDSNGTAYHPNPIWVRASSSTHAWYDDTTVMPFDEKTFGSVLGKAAFNTSTYKFTAPVAGAYLSALTGMTLDNGQRNAETMQYVNGSEVTPRVYTTAGYTAGGNGHNGFSNTQILQLAANDVLHWQSSALDIYMFRSYTGWFIYFLG